MATTVVVVRGTGTTTRGVGSNGRIEKAAGPVSPFAFFFVHIAPRAPGPVVNGRFFESKVYKHPGVVRLRPYRRLSFCEATRPKTKKSEAQMPKRPNPIKK